MMKKVSDIPLRLGLARFGHKFKTTASIGELKEDTVLSYCTKELSREYPQYKIKLRGVGEYYFFDEQNLRVICITGGVDQKESIIDALMEFVQPTVKQQKKIPVLTEEPLPVTPQPVKGEKGDKGDRGETGPRGMMGPEGPQGPQGVAGEKGEPGINGSDGVQGPQGERGEPGPQGEKGEKGDRGEQGATGEVGSQGPQGVQGSKGDKGDKGEKGDQGVPGKKGDRGKTGPKGARGEKGSTGPRGDKGERGDQGIQGPVGASGGIGPMGPQGVAGPQGPKGDLGISSAVYPLKLDSRTISVEQKFFNDLVNGAVQKHTAQGGGGGNVIIKHEGVRLSSAVKSINFTGSGISSVSSDGKNINIEITGGGGGGGVPTSNRFTYADDPPESPINGDRWFESDTGKYFVYIDDGDSSQWVQIVTSGGSQGDPGDPGVSVQDGYVNTDGDLILVLSDDTTVNVGSVIGPAGPQGLTGPQGPQGATGATGATGPQGPAGAGGALGYWGSFWSNQDQTATAANTGYAITIEHTDPDSSGVYISNSSHINFQHAGVYSIIYSIQFANTHVQIHDVNVWIKKNGSNLSDSDSKWSVVESHGGEEGHAIGAVNFVLKLNAGDYIELFWQTSDTRLIIQEDPAVPPAPAIPSVIVTATQVMYAQVGPQGPQGDVGVDVTNAIVSTDGDLLITLSDATVINAGNVIGPTGETGATGATGPQGPAGATGATGPQGIQGETGLGVSDVLVNTNGDLIVTLTDSSVINAGYVVGPQGLQGVAGATGSQGIQGETGPTGPQGIQGETGATGATGSQGPAGETGATGPQGPQGEPGLQDDVISLYIDGTPDVISTGKKAFRLIPYDCEVVEWYVVASVAGTIEFDVRASSFASYPSTTSIVGTTSDYPSLNNEVKNSNTSVTGWDVLNAGDMVDLYITSNTDVQNVGLFIKIRRI
jgi:hypothetical protein